MSVASKQADDCLTHVQTIYHQINHLEQIVFIQRAFRNYLVMNYENTEQ